MELGLVAPARMRVGAVGPPAPAGGRGPRWRWNGGLVGETCPSAGWGLGEGGTPAGQGRVAGEGGDFTRRDNQTWDRSMVWGYRGGILDCLGARWKVRPEWDVF